MTNQKLSAVDLKSCHKIINSCAPFILVMNKGESLIESLIKCAEIVKFPSATLLGIGALENPILGKYNFETKKHESKMVPGIYELTNLTGNIAKYDGKYLAHLHVTLGELGADHFDSITGHLIESPIGIIAEITIIPFVTPIVREFDPKLQGAVIKISG